MKKLFKWIVSAFILSIVLSACGGGTSSSNPTPTTDEVVMNNSNGAVADGQTNVVLKPSLGIQFTSPVDTSTVNASTVCLAIDSSCTSQITLTSFTANNANTAFSFAPVNSLQPNTKYYLIVNGVKSASGVNVTKNTFSFTTGSSTIPMVSIINPSNAATNVSRSPSIQFQFSESMLNVNSTNVTLTELESNGTQVPISGIIAGSNFSYTFSPSSPLVEGTKYYVNISSNVITADGNANHLSPTSFFFTTGDTSNPTVVMSSPSNGATNISTSQIVNLTFSETVVGVTESSLVVYESTNNTGLIKAYSITKSDNTYSLTFQSPLLEQTTYYVSVGSPIKDLRGNPLVNQVFSFTTGDFTNPTVTLTGAVQNNAIDVNLNPIITLQFSEGVLGVESNISIGQIGAGVVPAESYTVTKVNNSRYTVSFNSSLNEYTGYYIILNDNITDISTDRNPLPQTSFTFTTANVSAPTVQINAPANGSTTVTTTPIITIQFSKAVNGILPNQNVKLYRDESRGELVTVTNVVAGANNTFEVQYSGSLDQGITYSLVIGEGNNQIEDDNSTPLDRTEFKFTVGDLIRPTVSLLNPSDGGSGVTKLPMIQLSFSESVTNFESNIQLIGPNGNISIATPIMGSGNIVTVYPQLDNNNQPLLQNNTLYTLYVKSGIVDSSGNNHLVEKGFTFTTGTSSTVQSALVSPESGGAPISTTPTLLVRFSAPITAAGNPPTGFSLNNGASVTSLSNSPGNNVYQVNYNPNPLATGTTYTLGLSSVPSTYFGNVQSTSYTFTTTDSQNPYVISSNPANGNSISPNLSTFSITFSKPVAGVTSSNICLQESNFNTAGWQGCQSLNLTSGNKGDTVYTFALINSPNFYPTGNDVRIYIPASNGIYSVEPGSFGALVAESTVALFTVN